MTSKKKIDGFGKDRHSTYDLILVFVIGFLIGTFIFGNPLYHAQEIQKLKNEADYWRTLNHFSDIRGIEVTAKYYECLFNFTQEMKGGKCCEMWEFENCTCYLM